MLKLEGLPLGRNAEVTAPAASGSALRPPAPELELMAELKSGSTTAVERALTRASRFERMHVAADDRPAGVGRSHASVRKALEPVAPAHLGLLWMRCLTPRPISHPPPPAPSSWHCRRQRGASTALVRGSTMRASRCATTAAARSIGSWRRTPLTVDRGARSAVVERELSVRRRSGTAIGCWIVRRLDEAGTANLQRPSLRDRNAEHVFSLLSTDRAARASRRGRPRYPLRPTPASGGWRSSTSDQVLPAGVR